MNKFKNFLKHFLSAVYPNKCICCSEIIDEGISICNKCNKVIERNNLNDFCVLCGCEKQECVCKYNVYRFDAIVCVFKNIGYARKAYYAYKFGKKQHFVNFFANEMCGAIKQCFDDIDFDYICSVPPTKKYHYDHSGYLAKEISKKLQIPYLNNVLSCSKKTKKQHNSTIKERLKNTDGKYKYNYRVDDACILLVDDIKTTGATVDECAKMLLYAGAKSVYCITTLGASKKLN